MSHGLQHADGILSAVTAAHGLTPPYKLLSTQHVQTVITLFGAILRSPYTSHVQLQHSTGIVRNCAKNPSGNQLRNVQHKQ